VWETRATARGPRQKGRGRSRRHLSHASRSCQSPATESIELRAPRPAGSSPCHGAESGVVLLRGGRPAPHGGKSASTRTLSLPSRVVARSNACHRGMHRHR
jgi:hypothetical protein